jgi:hypothetical protein
MYNVIIDLREIGWDGMDWKFLTGGFSRRAQFHEVS